MALDLNKEDIYSDIDILKDINSTTKDTYIITNEQAVKQSLKNLIFTRFMERKFNPLIGCGVSNLLFDLPNAQTSYSIKSQIETLINNFEKT